MSELLSDALNHWTGHDLTRIDCESDCDWGAMGGSVHWPLQLVNNYRGQSELAAQSSSSVLVEAELARLSNGL